jgi:hypothetical protein
MSCLLSRVLRWKHYQFFILVFAAFLVFGTGSNGFVILLIALIILAATFVPDEKMQTGHGAYMPHHDEHHDEEIASE